MDTKELLKKVRKIEIKTKGLSNQVFSGEYHSAFKGKGMAFSEVREYMPGDEIRTIKRLTIDYPNDVMPRMTIQERTLYGQNVIQFLSALRYFCISPQYIHENILFNLNSSFCVPYDIWHFVLLKTIKYSL